MQQIPISLTTQKKIDIRAHTFSHNKTLGRHSSYVCGEMLLTRHSPLYPAHTPPPSAHTAHSIDEGGAEKYPRTAEYLAAVPFINYRFKSSVIQLRKGLSLN